MALQQLKDTKIPKIYQTGLYSEKSMDLSWEHTDKMLSTMVAGVTEYLSSIKSKDYPVAFAFRESNDEFIAAAVVEFHEGNKGEVGNWSYSWTFYEDDIPSNARIENPYKAEIVQYFRNIAINKYSMIFDQPDYPGIMFSYLLSVIKKYLNDNASESEEWGVKLDGVIQFRVAVEDGEKVLSAEVDGEIKQLIKDDAAIEK